MKNARLTLGICAGLLAAGGALGFLAGCGAVGDEGGYTEVYGDYGYDGPWVYGGGFAADGYHVSRPPYEHPGDQGHAEDRGHPTSGGASHAPPSIPNRPRPSSGGGHPSGGGGHSGGGGGGGHSGGGGGGGHSSGDGHH